VLELGTSFENKLWEAILAKERKPMNMVTQFGCVEGVD